MRIELDVSALHRTRWSEYAVRFLFGGIVTAATGLIAKQFGPVVAGLFLAFPAIFPAGATLIEKHEKQKKQDAASTALHEVDPSLASMQQARQWEAWD
jgi:hypothetical protein